MEEWKEYKIEETSIEMVDGDRGKNYPKNNDFFTEGYCLFLNAGNVTKNGFTFSENSFITREKDDTLRKGRLERNDVVITTRGTVGNVALYDMNVPFEHVRINSGMLILKSGRDILPEYLYYFLKGNTFQTQISQYVSGSAQPQLPKSTLAKMSISYPDNKDTQKRIIAILKSLDDKIEVNRRINDNLEQQAQALFKSWFVDFEPFKNGEFVESELGMIPKGWRVGKLGEICNVFTGKKDVKQSQPIGLYPFFSCSPNHTYSNEYIYDGPSIIIAGNGSYTGRTSFYFGKFDLYQRTYACTIKEGFNEKIISFLYYMMKCLFEPVKMGGTRGSSIPYIVMNDIVLQKFALDNSLVEKYSDFAYNVMKQIQRNNQESHRLAELRDTLLPKLMSGELKVNEIEI